jgi:hypothetical protein
VEEQQSQLFRHPPAAAQFCFCLYGQTLLTWVLALDAEARLGESGQGVRRAPSSAQAATSFSRACCLGVLLFRRFWLFRRGVQDAFVRR